MEDNVLKTVITKQVEILFREWDAEDISSITDRIIDQVVEDVKETSNYPDYNDSDVRIAIKRVVLFNLG